MMRLAALFCFALVSFNSVAETLMLGVVGGFKPAMQPLITLFEKQTGAKVLASYASVGVLYTQIQQGAPFDVLISADTETPERLEKQGIGITGTRRSYAISQLVLWSSFNNKIDSTPAILYQQQFTHIALANPKVAVHGKAAIQVLDNLGLSAALTDKFVQGKNVLQTFQFIDSQAAEIGFINMALIYRGDNPISGSYWVVPDNLYEPIEQQAICLVNGKQTKLAQQFINFLVSPAAQETIKYYGYRLPNRHG